MIGTLSPAVTRQNIGRAEKRDGGTSGLLLFEAAHFEESHNTLRHACGQVFELFRAWQQAGPIMLLICW